MSNRIVLLLASVLVYVASLFLPAVHGGGTYLVGLTIGILGFLTADSYAWYSNILYFFAILAFLFRRHKWAFSLSVAAALLGLDTFRLSQFQIDSAGYRVPVDHVGLAFYVWEAAFLILAMAAWAHAFRPSPPSHGMSGNQG